MCYCVGLNEEFPYPYLFIRITIRISSSSSTSCSSNTVHGSVSLPHYRTLFLVIHIQAEPYIGWAHSSLGLEKV